MIDANAFATDFDFNTATGLVFIDDNILVRRRDSKTFFHPLKLDLPGGKKSSNESPFDSFIRGLKKEFNVTVEKTDIVFAKSYTSTIEPTKISYLFVAKSSLLHQHNICFAYTGLEYYCMTVHEFLLRTDAVESQQERVRDYLHTVCTELI